MPMRSQQWLRRSLLAALLLLASPAAHASSQVVLAYPPTFGDLAATTYDDAGQRVGGSSLSLLRDDDDRVHIAVRTGASGEARSRASAELAVVDDGRGLRLLREESLSHDADGRPLDLLRVDHERGEASCTPRGGEGKPVSVPLPKDERVVNVPLNLLFLPLVRGAVKQVDFQLFLCGGGARVMDFRATVAGSSNTGDDHRIVEVSYGPDLGFVVSGLASAFLPRLSFWFEADGNGTYLAHRMPLFSKGPEVTVVRDGFSPVVLSH